MPKIFTTKDKKAASEMLLEGASVKAVATKFKVHVSTIYALRKDLGHGYAFTNSACRNVHVRLTNKEFTALDDFVAGAGFSSRTAALRSLIRAATGFLELPREEYLDLKAVRDELTAQGRNLNQIGYPCRTQLSSPISAATHMTWVSPRASIAVATAKGGFAITQCVAY